VPTCNVYIYLAFQEKEGINEEMNQIKEGVFPLNENKTETQKGRNRHNKSNPSLIPFKHYRLKFKREILCKDDSKFPTYNN